MVMVANNFSFMIYKFQFQYVYTGSRRYCRYMDSNRAEFRRTLPLYTGHHQLSGSPCLCCLHHGGFLETDQWTGKWNIMLYYIINKLSSVVEYHAIIYGASAFAVEPVCVVFYHFIFHYVQATLVIWRLCLCRASFYIIFVIHSINSNLALLSVSCSIILYSIMYKQHLFSGARVCAVASVYMLTKLTKLL